MTLPKKLTFIDSYLFLLSSLRKLPKIFDLKVEKSYFPHKFNKIENFNYVGKVPDKFFYGYDEMKGIDRADFLHWYERQEKFDFKNDMIKYCLQDCFVLAKAFLSFRDLILLTTNKIDVFLENSFTLSGLVMQIFRMNHLPPKLILNIPRQRMKFNASKLSTGYIDHINSERSKVGLPIFFHSENFFPGEIRVGNFFLDGFCPTTNEAVEVNGCLYHAHSCNTADTASSTTLRKAAYLQKWGLHLKTVYECEIPKSLKSQIYLKSNIPKLVPDSALFGGRTEVFCRFLQNSDRITLRYIDVISLYPYVLRSKYFPINTFQIIRPHVEPSFTFEIEKVFGLVFCKILPPRGLFVPVLPTKIRKKTIFTLCRLCAEENKYSNKVLDITQGDDLPDQLQFCFHNDQQRCFVGVYTSVELELALKFNYKILEIYEIWHFKEKSNQLFTDFINTYFKFKLESSGFPSHVKTDSDKIAYVRQVETLDNVKLDIDNIKSNTGLRLISKSILCSLWGRFGMKTFPKSGYFNEVEIGKMLLSSNFKIHQIYPISVETSLVSFEKLDNKYKRNRYSTSINIILSFFTTAYARIELYNALVRIKPSMLGACDTDSVQMSYFTSENCPIKLGQTLGEFTDEITKSYGTNATLQEIVSPGSKQNSRKIYLPEEEKFVYEIVCRGFTRTNIFQDKITHTMMKSAVITQSDEETVIPYVKFIRDKETLSIHTVEQNKRYTPVQDKRMLVKNSTITFPFGF